MEGTLIGDRDTLQPPSLPLPVRLRTPVTLPQLFSEPTVLDTLGPVLRTGETWSLRSRHHPVTPDPEGSHSPETVLGGVYAGGWSALLLLDEGDVSMGIES